MKNFLDWVAMRFHNHRWEIIETVPVKVYREKVGDPNQLTNSYRKLILQCKVCGEIKTKDIEV